MRDAVINEHRTLVPSDRDEIVKSRAPENIRIARSNQGRMAPRSQCLTCKGRGCIGHCRFAKPVPMRTPVPPRGASEATTQPRLYRSPIEPFHWLVWTDEGWFRFPAKPDGWAERRAATDVSHQKLQQVPLRMAFNTGLIESFELQIPNRAA